MGGNACGFGELAPHSYPLSILPPLSCTQTNQFDPAYGNPQLLLAVQLLLLLVLNDLYVPLHCALLAYCSLFRFPSPPSLARSPPLLQSALFRWPPICSVLYEPGNSVIHYPFKPSFITYLHIPTLYSICSFPSLPPLPPPPNSDNARHLWRRIDGIHKDAPTAEAVQLQQAWGVGKLLWER